MSSTLDVIQFSRILKYLEATAGRDKIVRLMQYGSRFLAWYLLINNNKSPVAKKLESLEAHSSMARKVFRLFKSFSFLQNAAKAYVEESDVVVKSTTVIQNLCLAVWLIYDHIIWAGKLNLIQTDIKAHARTSNSFWMTSMIMAVIKGIYLIQQTQQLANETSKPETLESLRKRQLSFLEELLRNAIDIPIPLTGLSEKAASAIPSGIVGLCGAVTSVIGIHQVWAKIT